MKAPAFDYMRAENLEQVHDLLSRYGDDARLLAGGQTLLATLNMRLSEPKVLIDLSDVLEMRGLAVVEGALRIGAMTRHVEIEESPIIAKHAPLLRLAAPHVAHRAIRNLGTIGGSLAYADPAAEWPACMLALDAVFSVSGPTGMRKVAADEFFLGLYETALAPDEVLVSIEVPVHEQGERTAFDELARRHGDYAIAGIAARAKWDGERLRGLHLAFLGVADRPLRLKAAEQILEGQVLCEEAISKAASVLHEQLEPPSDLTSGSATKRHLATVLMRRAVGQLSRKEKNPRLTPLSLE